MLFRDDFLIALPGVDDVLSCQGGTGSITGSYLAGICIGVGFRRRLRLAYLTRREFEGAEVRRLLCAADGSGNGCVCLQDLQ